MSRWILNSRNITILALITTGTKIDIVTSVKTEGGAGMYSSDTDASPPPIHMPIYFIYVYTYVIW